MFKEFKEFAMKGNMLDMAVGIVMKLRIATIFYLTAIPLMLVSTGEIVRNL